jgi:AcrB/AcrD/AcrF family
MKLYKVTLQQLFQALSNGNANAGGSYVEQGKQQFLIRGIGLFRSSEDIGNVVVDARNGTPILVRHIADVSVGNVPRQGIMGHDEADDVVTGIVLLRQGENPSSVLTALKAKSATPGICFSCRSTTQSDRLLVAAQCRTDSSADLIAGVPARATAMRTRPHFFGRWAAAGGTTAM